MASPVGLGSSCCTHSGNLFPVVGSSGTCSTHVRDLRRRLLRSLILLVMIVPRPLGILFLPSLLLLALLLLDILCIFFHIAVPDLPPGMSRLDPDGILAGAKECQVVLRQRITHQTPHVVIVGVAIHARAPVVHGLDVTGGSDRPRTTTIGRLLWPRATIWSNLSVGHLTPSCKGVAPLSADELHTGRITSADLLRRRVFSAEIYNFAVSKR